MFERLNLLVSDEVINNIKSKSLVEGASTISQQYVKNLFLDFDQTWERKVDEAFLTLELEMHYSKHEILEGYLNTINFGQGNYGIESASNYYFNKHASELTLEEAIILAGIPKNPSNFNPISNYENAINRKNYVLNQMYIQKYISNEELKEDLESQIEKIDFEMENRNPMNARKSPKFSKYFDSLWKELDVDAKEK